MQVTVHNLTGGLLGSFPIHRYSENGQMLSCALTGGYCETVPKKNTAYSVTVEDPDNGLSLTKIAMFSSYNFLADKDGDGPAVIADNSLIFMMLE